jgi:hypothetical protein
VCHTLALPFTLKKYLKAKEELWKLKIVHHYTSSKIETSWFTATGDALCKLEGIESLSQQQQHND